MSLEQIELSSEKYWEAAYSQEQSETAQAVRLFRNRRALRSFSLCMFTVGLIFLVASNWHLAPSILDAADQFLAGFQNGVRALLLRI